MKNNSSVPNFAELPNKAPEFDLRDLLEAGAHFGHQKAKRDPKMEEWIYMDKDGVQIFDLAKTAEQLRLAYNYAYHLGSTGKTMVVVATKKQASDVVEQLAAENKMMFITSRWLGGFLSNWDQVSKSLKRMLKIEKGLESDEFKGYTKYEIVQLEKEMNRLRRFFRGVRALTQKPDSLFVIDPRRESISVKEAANLGIPVIALIDSNTNPAGVTLPIPANDDAVKSIEYIAKAVMEGYSAGAAAGQKGGAKVAKADPKATEEIAEPAKKAESAKKEETDKTEKPAKKETKKDKE